MEMRASSLPRAFGGTTNEASYHKQRVPILSEPPVALNRPGDQRRPVRLLPCLGFLNNGLHVGARV
jgi:hypothetical protein